MLGSNPPTASRNSGSDTIALTAIASSEAVMMATPIEEPRPDGDPRLVDRRLVDRRLVDWGRGAATRLPSVLTPPPAA
jgi:hypothetical protein